MLTALYPIWLPMKLVHMLEISKMRSNGDIQNKFHCVSLNMVTQTTAEMTCRDITKSTSVLNCSWVGESSNQMHLRLSQKREQAEVLRVNGNLQSERNSRYSG